MHWRAHPIYFAAYLAVGLDPNELEPAACHRGGPAPRLGRLEQTRVGLWCARVVVESGDGTLPQYDALLAAAEEFCGDPANLYARFDLRPYLSTIHAPWEQPPSRESIAWRAVETVARLRNQRRRISKRVRGTAWITGLHLRARAEWDSAAIRHRFLEPLDDRLQTLEMLAMGRRFRENLERDFEGLVYRGSTRGRQADVWLMHVAGKLALLARLGRKWGFFEGTEDAVLPNVPDACFEAAARALQR